MYYKKRPELISMVEDFYRTHRSLAERYDQVKPDTGFRQLKLFTFGDNGHDIDSEDCDVDESMESEVDDPEKEEEESNCTKENEVVFVNANDEVMRLSKEIERLNEVNKAYKDEINQKDKIYGEVMVLREEVERLKNENKAQKDQLKQKDEDKIEVIRHLSVAMDVLKQETVKLRTLIPEESKKKWKNSFEFNEVMRALSQKWFYGRITRNQTKDAPLETGAGAGVDTDGGKADTDPGLPKTSMLGGLGLEGMVGNEDSDGEKAAPPGVGKRGSISGDSARGASDNIAGAAEMVETCMFCIEAKANEQLHAIKAMNIDENSKQKEAIKEG
ncbi:hypothetical protein Lal_00047001 [Lupinus albus]|nr:hypothetical protein Lal_00047001 [Lupinus albus]